MLDGAASTPAIEVDAVVTLTFGDDVVSGQGPCNSFRTGFEVDGDEIDLGEIASTRMACGDDADAAEATFFAALAAVDHVDTTDPPRLELTGDDVTLEFERAPE